jgi:chromosome segregation ATPase
MSRRLQILNLSGVLALAVLCGVQWQASRKLSHEIAATIKARDALTAKVAEQEKSIAGLTADLDAFRTQYEQAARARKEASDKNETLQRENTNLAAQVDQLKENVARWTDAVAERDERLKEARDQIQTLAVDRNAAVEKFNELAEKHNANIEQLNSRTRDYNALVEKYNTLAKRIAEEAKK